MTAATAQNTRRASASTVSAASIAVTPWVRPAAWLALPDVTGLQRFVGLHAIFPSGNFVALSATGNYTVDWGDGTTTNHNSGVIAYKEYTYSSISDAGEAALGYRQAIIQVYPQSGQNLTNVNIQRVHNQSGLVTAGTTYATGWLDVAINSANLTTLSIGGTQPSHRLLQRVFIGQHAITSCASLFQNCTALQSVPLFDTANVTSMNTMFRGCVALTEVPPFNTPAVTNTGFMFTDCVSLRTVPLFNTAAVTNMTSMFQGCTSLRSVPLFNTAAVTSMTSMFQSCSCLRSVPLFNTAAATNMAAMVRGCVSLVTLPAFNTSANTTFQDFARDCFLITVVPALNASASTLMGGLVQTCPNLVRCAMTGINATVSFASCKLSAAELNAIFTSLSSTGTGKTITVTGNYGTATCDTSIATAKGWTVTV